MSQDKVAQQPLGGLLTSLKVGAGNIPDLSTGMQSTTKSKNIIRMRKLKNLLANKQTRTLTNETN